VSTFDSRHKCRGLPFDKLKAPSIVEGLRVDPERAFPSRLEGGLSAVEWVNENWKREIGWKDEGFGET